VAVIEPVNKPAKKSSTRNQCITSVSNDWPSFQSVMLKIGLKLPESPNTSSLSAIAYSCKVHVILLTDELVVTRNYPGHLHFDPTEQNVEFVS
jgi:hypothetical protein